MGPSGDPQTSKFKRVWDPTVDGVIIWSGVEGTASPQITWSTASPSVFLIKTSMWPEHLIGGSSRICPDSEWPAVCWLPAQHQAPHWPLCWDRWHYNKNDLIWGQQVPERGPQSALQSPTMCKRCHLQYIPGFARIICVLLHKLGGSEVILRVRGNHWGWMRMCARFSTVF